MSRISYDRIRVIDGSRVEARVTRDDDAELLWFEAPFEFRPHDDLIAVTLATLAGRKFDEVSIDLAVSDRCSATLSEITGVKVQHGAGPAHYRGIGPTMGLAFSGGYDSLAALEFMPKHGTELISLDFGGRFAREREFFSRFETNILSTNLVTLGLHRNNWAFMVAGHILFRDALRLGGYAFGTVLEASSAVMSPTYRHHFAVIPAMKYLGMSLYNPVAGLTEFATLATVFLTQPQLVTDCLASVANVGEGKYLRKYLMVEAVAAHLGVEASLPDRPLGSRWFDLGDDFASDFLSPFLIKYCGADAVGELYKKDLPAGLVDFASTGDVGFFTKLNTTVTEAMGPELRRRVMSVAAEIGIDPYGRDDWHALDAWRAKMVELGMLAG